MILTFLYDDHARRMPLGYAISVLSLAVWWAKLEINATVRHNNIVIMTQIAC